MKRNLTIDPNTIYLQSQASHPSNSAWVSANAGSGKTFVLSRRVVRLLLAGVDPSRILCLTFTKAAAGEMSNRVFDILSNWVSISDEKLKEELGTVEGKAPTPEQMKRARTLFARALETPGGLKIQTIHAFCESLLHRFPLEANVPGKFKVMEDGQQRQLIHEARRYVILAAGAEPDGALGRSFDAMVEFATDNAIEKVLGEIVSHRDALARWLKASGGPDAATEAAKESLGFTVGASSLQFKEDLVADSLLWQLDIKQSAQQCGAIDQKTAIELAQYLITFESSKDPSERLAALSNIVLTAQGSARKFERYPPNAVEEAVPGIRALLASEAERLVSALSRYNTLRSIEETKSVLVIAEEMIAHYERNKRRRGLLDYDDLILKTADLVSRSDARAWVLYKLDLGIDHILLDEAQDTSPEQWRIISALGDEFFSGISARNANRTVFTVGDEKQSIYSFQGARPESFDLQRRMFKRRATNSEREFQDIGLGLSFRSTDDVLRAVDAVFAIEEHAKGLIFGDNPPPHTSARRGESGCVDVWPLVEPVSEDPPEDWHVPIEHHSNQHQADRLAEKIASNLEEMIGIERLESNGKLIDAGDILILVRSRDRFIPALTRALRGCNISVAGADRLKITDHIAVEDLMALGHFMLTPEDDLSLAALLKSPLIGFNEDQLYDLARGRLKPRYEMSLFEALRDGEHPELLNAYETLKNWRNIADTSPVYEFFAQVLEADGGRRKFISRLGTEAEDVLDAFMDATLAHEQTGLPGLHAFLHHLADTTPEIKREMDSSLGEVRIMTVHAAKGLEAPIVFLVDKCSTVFQEANAPALFRWKQPTGQKGYLWVPTTSHHGDVTNDLKAEAKRLSEEEYRRLLYVAMTRAEDRLIICGYRGKKNPPSPNWHAMVSRALEPDWQEVQSAEGDIAYFRWKVPASSNLSPFDHEDAYQAAQPDMIPLPGWINHMLPVETALPRPLNPSGAQALIDEALLQSSTTGSLLDTVKNTNSGLSPQKRGTIIHKLLQKLPEIPNSQRAQSARAYLEHVLFDADFDFRRALEGEVFGVLESPLLENCFNSETSVAEVPILGEIEIAGKPRSISGTIDRLTVFDNHLVVLDYKTSLFVPSDVSSVAPDILLQLALYRKLLLPLYPGKTVQTVLVWTHGKSGPVIMTVPGALLDQAILQIT